MNTKQLSGVLADRISCARSRQCNVASRLMVLLVLAALPTCTAKGQTSPVVTAQIINQRLQKLFLEIDSLHEVQSDASMANRLKKDLLVLNGLDVPIKQMRDGVGDQRLKREAVRYRAMAWLHGWAVFGRLVMETGDPGGSSELRLALTNLMDSQSALTLLLNCYREIQEADNTAEPLQDILSSDADFVIFSSLNDLWEGDRPPGFPHAHYIPAAANIVGQPDDTSLRRHLFSLWALVNLQLDTWQNLQFEKSSAAEFAELDKISRAQTVKNQRTLLGNTMQLAALIGWLSDLQNNPNLSALDGPNSSRPASEFKLRIEKITLFLKFREQNAEPKEFAKLIEDLASVLKQNDGGKDPRQVIQTLVQAATPLTSEGIASDVLYDAAIWLRYVLTLSYQTRGAAIVSAGDDSLEAIWQKYKLPGSVQLSVPGRPPSASLSTKNYNRPAFIRWNAWPQAGSCDDVIGGLFTSTYGYLAFNTYLVSMEKARFISFSDSSERKTYASDLAKRIAGLRNIEEQTLSPYFVLGAGTEGRNDLYEPIALTSQTGSMSRAFRMTATTEEQNRLVGDLSAVRTTIKTELGFNDAMERIYQQDAPQAVARSLQFLGGTTTFSSFNPYVLPSKTFKEYQRALKNSIESLQKGLDVTEADAERRDIFKERQTGYKQAKLQFEAARLGRRVAVQATALSEEYAKVAAIDAQAEELSKKIAALESRAYKSKEEAEAARLEYATRMRDLAAARVEALIAASADAGKMVDSAVRELKELQPQLRASAREIKSQRDHQATIGIINTVITVVGAALAPFTGGASLAIALVVRQGIATYDKIKTTDWSKLPEAIAVSAQVVGMVSQYTTFDPSKVTPQELQSALATCNMYLKSANTTLQSLSQPAQELIKSVQNLPEKDSIVRFASAIASGYPLSLGPEKNTLQLAIDGRALHLKDEKLQLGLAAILDSGGMIVNDFRARTEILSQLPGLDGAALKGKLKDSLDLVIRPMPDELLRSAGLQDKTLQLEQARKQLGEQIDKLDDESTRVFANALASGLVFVKDTATAKVVGIQGAVNAEVEKYNDRMQRFADNVQKGALKELAANIESVRAGINNSSQQLVASHDDAGLIDYAERQLPQKMDAMRDELVKLKQKIEEAQDLLEDEKTKVTIASYDADAARYFSRAAEIKGEQATLLARKAGIASDIAQLQILQSMTELQQQDLVFQSSFEALQIARSSLERTYQACLTHGFDPLATEEEARIHDVSDAISLRRLVSLLGSSSQIGIDAVASNIGGELQWIRLLHLSSLKPDKRTALDWYLATAKALHSGDRERLEGIAKELDNLYAFAEQVPSSIRVWQDVYTDIGESEVLWFDQMTPADRDSILRGFPGQTFVNPVAVIRVSFTLDRSKNSKLIHVPPMSSGPASYYMVLNEARMIRKPTGKDQVVNTTLLTFKVVPTNNPSGNPTDLIGGLPNGLNESQVLDSLDDAQWLQKVSDTLGAWQSLKLNGAVGSWTVFLFSSVDLKALKPAELLEFRKTLKLTLKLPYLEVPRGGVN